MSTNLDAGIGGWWQQRTPMVKKILIIAPISLLIVVVVSIVVILFTQSSERERNIAKALRNAMDISVNPCEDFFKYACGNWYKPYEKNLTIRNSIDILQRRVGIDFREAVKKHLSKTNLLDAEKKLSDAYNSCLKSNLSSYVLAQFVHDIGGFPQILKVWNESSYDLSAAIANAMLYFGVAPLVLISVLPDEKNTSRNFITLSPPGNGFRLIDPKMPELWKFRQQVTPDVKSMMELNSRLQSILTETQNLSRADDFMFVKLKDLSKKFDGVDYAKIIQITINSTLRNTKRFVKDDEKIAIDSFHYLKKFGDLVKNGTFSPRVYANFIGESVYSKYFGGGTMDIRPKNRSKTEEELRRQQAVCLQTLLEKFNFISDRYYIHEVGANSDSSIKQILEIIDYLKDSFETLAKQTDWIDSTTLPKIVEKLHAMRKFVGYSQWILDDEKLNSYYKNLPSMTSDYKTNIIKFNKFWMEKTSSKLYKLNTLNELCPTRCGGYNLSFRKKFLDVVKKRWRSSIPIISVNALYDSSINGIYIPFAILNTPFFYQDLPWYLNFGALGAVTGHEITHGFDTIGKFHDKDGNKDNLWTNKTEKEFNGKVSCFIEQYDSYIDPHTGYPAHGQQTVQENIADNGGIRQAFLAYQKWVEKHGQERLLPGFEGYTPNQLFFLSYAHLWCEKPVLRKRYKKTQTHSTRPIRVLGTLSNMKEFATSFNCEKGTKMNPEKKCIIW